jgi:hypothetical protein
MKRLFASVVTLFLSPIVVLAGKDPADYPLKVHVLQQNWGSHNVRYNEYRGIGRGNIWEADGVHAFDFTYDCSFPVRRTARNQPYLAKWKKAPTKLAVLAEKIGNEEKFQECDLKTTLHSGVYILANGGITEMSQADYKNFKARNDALQASGGASGASKVSVTSAPVSGEIEVDGEFMGNTPSVLDLQPGEHTIAIKKPGYKPWEKKLKVTGGSVSVSAELESENGQAQ